MVTGRPGATALSSGALDGNIEAAAEEARAFAGALGIWEIAPCRVATTAGLLRAAGGRDLAVLDLQRIEPGTVAVLDVARRGWDARALAESWSREPWAIERGLRFEPVSVEASRRADEESISCADLAERHDDPERVRWLAERLRESVSLRDARALMIGPWLGLRPGVAAELTRMLGKPVGEPLSAPGGAAGLRFDRARDELLALTGVERIDDWAVGVGVEETSAGVELASGSRMAADAVVLAVGGLAGGGIEWSPDGASSGFATSLGQPATLALHGEPLRASGSPEGALFEKHAWKGESVSSGLERVGIWTDAKGHALRYDRTPMPRLVAAGDAVADAPRNLLTAIRSGLVAGALAAVD
jgi:glycerol-3-phosphate dehydrogenase subunit B